MIELREGDEYKTNKKDLEFILKKYYYIDGERLEYLVSLMIGYQVMDINSHPEIPSNSFNIDIESLELMWNLDETELMVHTNFIPKDECLEYILDNEEIEYYPNTGITIIDIDTGHVPYCSVGWCKVNRK